MRRLNGPVELTVPLLPGSAHRVVRGRDNILHHRQLLESLCHLSSQEGELDTLHHFLTTSVALRKVPCLVLLQAPSDTQAPAVEGYSGAVLLFEYQILGRGLRLYATSDWTGRRNVFGPSAFKGYFAATASRLLIDRGAQIVSIAFHSPEHLPQAPEIAALLHDAASRVRWSLMGRQIHLYLPLKSTLDETIALFGQKTRRNMREARRRTEARFICQWVDNVDITQEEFVQINRLCSYPVGDRVARERYIGMKSHKHPFLSGLRAENGQWLALVMGWYRHNAVEVEWQMNRADLPEYSLSLVLRSFLIEYAIKHGYERLYLEGGTQHNIKNSFVLEPVHDLIVASGSTYASLVQRHAKRIFPKDNYLLTLLTQPHLQWRTE